MSDTIKLVGKILNYNSERAGEVFVEVDVDEALYSIDDDYLKDYAENYLDMVHCDDIESNLEDFEDVELVAEIEDRGYKVVEGELGFEIYPRSLTESIQIDELLEGFDKLDFEKRQIVLNLINVL